MGWVPQKPYPNIEKIYFLFLVGRAMEKASNTLAWECIPHNVVVSFSLTNEEHFGKVRP